MLVGLSIRDVVLIEQLSLSFAPGLTVLTGETGAGKSILLDALALALGERADSGLIRNTAPQASVTAEFSLGPGHAALPILEEHGIDGDDILVIRRVLTADGRSRAFVNDQPVSAGLLKRLAEVLVEIHGQFDTHGLFDARTHRAVLDQHGGLAKLVDAVRSAWKAWGAAEEERAALAQAAQAVRAEETFLREALEELERLALRPGEEAMLAETRQKLQHRDKLVDAMNTAQRELSGDHGAERALANARRAMDRVADRAGGAFDPILASLDRAAIEMAEATAALDAEAERFEDGTQSLESVDDRLFELRRVARRHNSAVDDLSSLRDALAAKLGGLDNQEARLADAARRAADLRNAFVKNAASLSEARRKAGAALDRAVEKELKPLKLDRAQFVTEVAPLGEAEWGETGVDRVVFAVATNPGQAPGPLAKIASGGELARFMLALKVVLSRVSGVPVLVFDEVDSGIGGATADAVGERLARLAQNVQVLVVTHSPQVAARGTHHWAVRKNLSGRGTMSTDVVALADTERREEIARMLSGANVTDEARAAAARLIEHAGLAGAA